MATADINKKYFLLSFRFNRSTPDDFGLVRSEEDAGIFIDKVDSSQWVLQQSYDFGWGNENGFMRIPELNFEQLWYIFINSAIEDNIYGCAHIIMEKYPDKLFEVLTGIFETNQNIDMRLKEAFKILKMQDARNRSEILGKSFVEIEEDFKKWKDISDMASDAIEER